MRSFYNFWCFIILTAIFIGCNAEKENNLKGVWQLASGEYTLQDTTITLPSSDYLKSFRFFGPSRFSVITQDTSKELFVVHSGTYRIDGDKYTENYEISNNLKSIGNSSTFKSEIRDDEWIIIGNSLSEVWKKIE